MPGVILYKNSIVAWESPLGKTPVSDEERDRIVRNVTRAFEFDGYASEVL